MIKLFWISKKLKKNLNNKIKNNKFEEANAWIKKYFKDASEYNKLLLFLIKGIKLIKLISKPIQQPNHELDEIEINELKNKIIIKNNLVEFKFK